MHEQEGRSYLKEENGRAHRVIVRSPDGIHNREVSVVGIIAWVVPRE